MSIAKTASHPRMQGVQHSAPTKNGAPRTVIGAEPLEQYAIYYFDETGQARVNILLKAGDRFFLAPNGVEWAASLKPAAEWLKKGVEPFLVQPESENTSVPKDGVDVLGEPDAGPSAE